MSVLSHPEDLAGSLAAAQIEPSLRRAEGTADHRAFVAASQVSAGPGRPSAKRPAPVFGWRGACGGARTQDPTGQAGYAGLAEWPTALSSLQFRAQLHGPADGPAHPPFRPLGTPRFPGKCGELPSP